MNVLKPRRILVLLFCLFCLMQLFSWTSQAASDTSANIKPQVSAVGTTGKAMTLWQMLVAGGSVMIVIGLLSVVTGALIVYDFMTFNIPKLAPTKFSEEVIQKLENKDLKDARDLCALENNNNIIARIVITALDRAKRNPGHALMKEAIENRARMEIGNLWQNLNYLSDIVAVAPLLGLLGTVFGMIEAFHAVPLQSTGLKTTLLAAGISKAMVNTAGGLIVAIAALMAYSYFRGKVQEVTNAIESYSTELIKVMAEA